MKRLVVLLALVAAALCIAETASASPVVGMFGPYVVAPSGTLTLQLTQQRGVAGSYIRVTDPSNTTIYSTTTIQACTGQSIPSGSFTCAVPAPSSPGLYYARWCYWVSGSSCWGWDPMAFVVSSGTVSIAPQGYGTNAITVSWQNATTTVPVFVGVYASTALGAALVDSFNPSCVAHAAAQNPPASGSCNYVLPTTAAAASYDFRFITNLQGANQSLAHAVPATVTVQPIDAQKTNGDDALFYSYDSFGWYHALNQGDANAWPQNCDNGTGGWTFCRVPNDSTHATFVCGSYGSVVDGSNNCLTRGEDFTYAHGSGVWQGDNSTGSSTGTLTEPCCAQLVEIPSGDLFFASGGGYIHIPSYADATNDGLHWDTTHNVWTDSNGVPVAQLKALPLPYLGEDIGCGCVPPSDPVDTTQACCPALVELPNGDLYQYNSAEGGYDLVPADVAESGNYGPLSAGLFGVLPGFTPNYCPDQADSGGDSGDFCGVTLLPALPLPMTGTKKRTQLQVGQFECSANPVGIDILGVGGANSLLAGANLRCEWGQGELNFTGKICIDKDYFTSTPMACQHYVKVPFDNIDSLPLSVPYVCQYTSSETAFRAFVKGVVKDQANGTATVLDSSRIFTVDPFEHPGGCDYTTIYG